MSDWFPPRRSAAAYCCVVGTPVAHSKSPLIHAAFAAETGIELDYDRVEVQPGTLAGAVTQFRQIGGIGMNVTVPLKLEAWSLAQVRSQRAQSAGAANTLWFDGDGQINADNTDGVGLVRDLTRNHHITLQDTTILLLGAGGAARGVVPALLDCAPKTLLISNRSAHKAKSLAEEFSGQTSIVEPVPWGDMRGIEQPQSIINATSLSLSGDVPPLDIDLLARAQICYDMMYSADESFTIWHGRTPQTGPVIKELRGL